MTDNDTSKNNLRFRVKIIYAVILVLCFILLFNLFMIQVNHAEKYSLMSDKNRIRLSPVLPKRGRIITSNGKIIAGNSYKYKLTSECCNEQIFEKNINILSKFIDITEQEKQRLLLLRKKSLPYATIVIKDNLSWDEYSKISTELFKLNHTSIENTFIRNYDMPMEFCHIVGYVSKSNDNIQILTGKTGLEASLDNYLIGKIGNIKTEINSVGKKIRIIDSVDAINGNDAVITIDSELQKYIYDLISEEKAGACIVLDISNGEVLSMVSMPAFNSSLVSNKITHSQWDSIANDPLFPLMNRAISCSYPPGSVFKIVVALAALSEKIIDPYDKIFCAGGTKQDDRVFHCWNRGGHGNLDLCGALSFSCDCYFFEISKKLGIDTIVKYASKLGFGSETGIELPNENAGLLPTKQWKFLKYRTAWKPYETMIAAIGQGALLATLLQMATMMGKIYTNNYNFCPILTKGHKKNHAISNIDRQHSEIIKKALYQVCSFGTASGSCNTPYGISGKTSSSQVKKIKSDEAGISQKNFQWKYRDHAFFVGCAPYNAPKYVVAVLIEHGGGGASVAAPIARKIFDRLMEKTYAQH